MCFCVLRLNARLASGCHQLGRCSSRPRYDKPLLMVRKVVAKDSPSASEIGSEKSDREAASVARGQAAVTGGECHISIGIEGMTEDRPVFLPHIAATEIMCGFQPSPVRVLPKAEKGGHRLQPLLIDEQGGDPRIRAGGVAGEDPRNEPVQHPSNDDAPKGEQTCLHETEA